MTKSPHPQAVAALLRENLAKGNHPRLKVISGSMAPTLRPGDNVVVESIHTVDLRIGDILVIQRQSDMLTHRLVAFHPAGCYTKGDHTAILDPLVSTESILGRVAIIERDQKSYDLTQNTINTILGKLGWWEANLYKISPAARLPIRLFTRIILWALYESFC
jgi:signal peptidase I